MPYAISSNTFLFVLFCLLGSCLLAASRASSRSSACLRAPSWTCTWTRRVASWPPRSPSTPTRPRWPWSTPTPRSGSSISPRSCRRTSTPTSSGATCGVCCGPPITLTCSWAWRRSKCTFSKVCVLRAYVAQYRVLCNGEIISLILWGSELYS